MNESLSDDAIKVAIILRRGNFPEDFINEVASALDKLPDVFSEYVLDFLNGHVSGTMTDSKHKTMEILFGLFCHEFGLSSDEINAFIEVLE